MDLANLQEGRMEENIWSQTPLVTFNSSQIGEREMLMCFVGLFLFWFIYVSDFSVIEHIVASLH